MRLQKEHPSLFSLNFLNHCMPPCENVTMMNHTSGRIQNKLCLSYSQHPLQLPELDSTDVLIAARRVFGRVSSVCIPSPRRQVILLSFDSTPDLMDAASKQVTELQLRHLTLTVTSTRLYDARGTPRPHHWSSDDNAMTIEDATLDAEWLQNLLSEQQQPGSAEQAQAAGASSNCDDIKFRSLCMYFSLESESAGDASELQPATLPFSDSD